MKKILLGTTALVAASMVAAPGARAAEPLKLGLGGFMVQAVNYASQDDDWETANGTDYNTFDQIQRSEVHFKGSTKLDNGISVAVDIELESDGNDNFGIDESYMTLTSATMGQVILGRAGGVAHLMHHNAPNATGVTWNGGDVQIDDMIIAPGAITTLGDSDLNDDGDINRASYISPTLAGFSVGVTWTPDETDAGSAGQPTNGSKWSVALAYDEDMGGVDVGADLAYTKASTVGGANEGMTGFRGGLNLSYAGFTVGGSYANQDQHRPSDALTANANLTDEGEMWDLGVSYGSGPYTVSATYYNRTSPGAWANTDEDQSTGMAFGGSYALGPGVNVLGSVFTADHDDETSANANNNDGWGALAGLAVSF